MELKNYFAQDIAGNILPNATIYLYLPDTTAPAEGLQKANGDALANPFQATAEGLIQFKAPNGEYDLRVVSHGRDYTLRVQCNDVRDAVQFDDFIDDNLKIRGGRSQKDKNAELVSVADYGASLDGVTDDYTALLAANAAAVAANVPLMIPGVMHIGTATIITAPIVDGLHQMFSATSQVTIDNEMPIRPDWWGDIEDSILKAIAATPASGGVIKLAIKRYKPNHTNYDVNYMAKANISIVGERMPEFSANCDRLENGSVIEGRFNVFADNFHHENVGYDLGKYVMDTYYPGYDSHSGNHPDGYTWDAFAFAQPNQGDPLADRRGYYAKNVRGLLRESASLGHAILQEGFSGGYIDNVVGMYGVHGHVIKASNIFGGHIAGYGASGDHVIIKSDSYAYCGNVNLDSVDTGKAPPNTAPWSEPAQSYYAVLLNPAANNMGQVKIGTMRCFGASNLFVVSGDPTKAIDNVQISRLEISGQSLVGGTIGINVESCKPYRFRIGAATIDNVWDGIAYANSAEGFASEPIKFDSLSITNSSLRAIQALGYGQIVIDHLRVNNIATLYSIDDNARVRIGVEEIVNAPTVAKFGNNPPALTAGWSESIVGSFRVLMRNYGVQLSGLLQQTGSPSADVVSLPTYLRPAIAIRTPAIAKNSGVYGAVAVGADPGYAYAVVNEGEGVTGTGQWLSLDGVGWLFD